MRGDRLEGATIVSRFPVAFRLPAFASWSSDSRRGVGPSSRSAYRTSPTARTSTGLPRSARTSCERGGRPLCPGDDGAPPGLRRVLSRRLPHHSGRPCTPPRHPISRGSASRGIKRGFTKFARPLFPSPVAPGWNGRPWASPRASHPAITSDARRGRGQAIEHGPGTTRSHQTDPPIRVVHSCRATSRRTARSSSPMPYASSSAAGDVGVARTGSRITRAMQPSAARGETGGPRPRRAWPRRRTRPLGLTAAKLLLSAPSVYAFSDHSPIVATFED